MGDGQPGLELGSPVLRQVATRRPFPVTKRLSSGPGRRISTSAGAFSKSQTRSSPEKPAPASAVAGTTTRSKLSRVEQPLQGMAVGAAALDAGVHRHTLGRRPAARSPPASASPSPPRPGSSSRAAAASAPPPGRPASASPPRLAPGAAPRRRARREISVPVKGRRIWWIGLRALGPAAAPAASERSGSRRPGRRRARRRSGRARRSPSPLLLAPAAGDDPHVHPGRGRSHQPLRQRLPQPRQAAAAAPTPRP